MNIRRERLNVLVTGAGGAAAIAFLRAVEQDPNVTVHMCDMDPNAQGLYLVAPAFRHLLPAAQAPDYMERLLCLCHQYAIDVVVPTVDCELPKVSAHRRTFAEAGIHLICAERRAVMLCNDKLRLMKSLPADKPWLGWAAPYDETFDFDAVKVPFIIKPRAGSGGRDVTLIRSRDDLLGIPTDGRFLAQEYLPGLEYSVDTYCDANNRAVARVVRERIKVDSGVAVVSRTVRAPQVANAAAEIATAIGLRYVSNIQFKLDRNGQPKLLEINARFPGTMPLTVAAGVNMPAMCLREARRDSLASNYDYRCMAMVRSWQETFLPADELMTDQDDDNAAERAA